MRLIIQRVSQANVKIENKLHSSIQQGFLILIGIESEDTIDDIEWLCGKIISMRIFSDNEGKMNLNINQINGNILVVSQFTLHASSKKGNRPSFIKAAKPNIAIPLYKKFIEELEKKLCKPIQSGLFGANMQIELINDGPVTLFLDSKNQE
jgi:D-tyrosyl-tRNA(Tyr) deacylase